MLSGTDQSRSRIEPRSQPAMVLVNPQMGENIGAAARAMWNFGLDRLRIVNPRDGWPNPKADAMASGAGRLLDEAWLTRTTAEACADLTYVFATTARDRALTKRVVTPEVAVAEALELTAAGEKVGFLFGAERAGLDKADVTRANSIVSVPVNPAFGSLNLAQCVLLVAYEWGRQSSETPKEVLPMQGGRLAAAGEVDGLIARVVERLDNVGFFYPEAKRQRMITNLENLFRRAAMTNADVQTLHGVTRALSEKVRGRK